MNRKIYTNLPDDKSEFAIMQKCFDGIGLPYTLLDGAGMMEKYVNNNNVFFYCTDDRDRRMVAIEKACNALHRIILNFELIGDVKEQD